jgi:succinyl-CoA synthetase alpha subunit
MSIIVNKNSNVLVQGFTGSEGTFHSEQMIEYGTNVVCGVTPGKGGTKHLDKPVYNSVADALKSEDYQYFNNFCTSNVCSRCNNGSCRG